MSDTTPSSLPGLSDTRLEEIEKLGITAGAYGDPIDHDNNNVAECTRCKIGVAFSDLLAEVRRLQGELASAREETAQAVREERRCCAQIADDEASKSDDIDAGYLSAQRIARKIRSRSHPGETADA